MSGIEAPPGWDDAAVRSPAGHVLQSVAWATVRASQGWEPEFVRVGEPLPVALVLWRRLPGGRRMGYVPRGPIVPPGDATALARALEVLADLARERGAVFLKVDPELEPAVAAEPLRAAGYRRGPDVQPVLATLELDLRPGPDALLAGFDKDTRWSVRTAAKRGVEVRVADDEAGMRAFHALYDVTGSRAGFITRTWEYYRAVWGALIDAGLATLRLAWHEGAPVAGAITWRCGERELYMYGASNDAGRRCYASYGLQWECIRAAHERGAVRYDLGGIPLDLEDRSDPMRGPYLFKKGFGGDVKRFVGAHDTVVSPAAYRTFVALEPLYTRALRLLGRVRRA